MYALSQPQTANGETCAARSREPQREPVYQRLTLILDGITSDDYLQWVRDPNPPDRDDLKLISVQSAPLSDRIQLDVISDGDLPTATAAAQALGFPVIAGVVVVNATSGYASLSAGSAQPDRSSTGRTSLERGANGGQQPAARRRTSDPSGSSVIA